MERHLTIENVWFPSEVLDEAVNQFTSKTKSGKPHFSSLEVRELHETWTFDTLDEFKSAYDGPSVRGATLTVFGPDASMESMRLHVGRDADLYVSFPDRASIMAVSNIFTGKAERFRNPPPVVAPKKPRIFIGHGHSSEWSDLKNHLTDKHGLDVQAFEVGARAGHTVRDILDDLMTNSSFAILVMTGEDELATGELRPRENVIHEAGLFQGKLGFSRAIVLVENDVTPFSNLDGIQYISFGVDNIKETFGEVLATLRREFGPF